MTKLQKKPHQRPATPSAATANSRGPMTTSIRMIEVKAKACSVAREASSVLPRAMESVAKSCSPINVPIADWSKPVPPKELEFLIDEGSAVAKNLENPKVLHLTGIKKVTRLQMAPPGTTVMLAK